MKKKIDSAKQMQIVEKYIYSGKNIDSGEKKD